MKKPSPRRAFYRKVLSVLHDARLPFVVGGAYAFTYYSGVKRPTKDVDVFLPREAWAAASERLEAAGLHTELTFRHWLGKAREGPYFADLIFCGANGVTCVDEVWVARAPVGRVLDVEVRICPVEEMIWSKAFVMERERFDGADVLHLVRATHRVIDWAHLLDRFGEHWPVLLSHLALFGYVYPSEREAIPAWVTDELASRLRFRDDTHRHARLCRGTLLSRAQYLVDVEHWGYHDARVPPFGTVQPQEMEPWTAEIDPKLRPASVRRRSA
jgi:hypothetical protein